MDREELGDIESGSLEGFDFSDDAVVDGEDLLGLLGDLSGDLFVDEFLDDLLEGVLGDFLGDDLAHLPSDLFDLGPLGVGGGLELELASLGEGDGEEPEEEPVAGLGVDDGFDEGVPLSDEGAEVVLGGVHSVEVGQSGPALGFGGVVDDQLDFLVGQGALSVQVAQVGLEDSALEGFRG